MKYVPHLHTKSCPDGFPVRPRRNPGCLMPMNVYKPGSAYEGLGDSQMHPGETPEQYRERRLRELNEPLQITVRQGAPGMLGTGLTTPVALVLGAVALLFLMR